MTPWDSGSFHNRLWQFFINRFGKIREINQRYATPRITMSRRVSLTLHILAGYIVLLCCILLLKFVTLLLA